MSEEQRRHYLFELDDELLIGGVALSEWCSFIVYEADTAFVAGAHLATIVTAMAGIETYLRSAFPESRRMTLYELIEQSPIADSLKFDIHTLRKYRNRWVHISDPEDDQDILEHPEKYIQELELRARKAVRTLRETIYENQWL